MERKEVKMRCVGGEREKGGPCENALPETHIICRRPSFYIAFFFFLSLSAFYLRFNLMHHTTSILLDIVAREAAMNAKLGISGPLWIVAYHESCQA